MSRKLIEEEVGKVSPYDFDGSLSDLQQIVGKLIEEYGEEARIDLGYTTGYDDTLIYTVTKERRETHEEMRVRIQRQRKSKELAEERERQEFARLQKKFSGE